MKKYLLPLLLILSPISFAASISDNPLQVSAKPENTCSINAENISFGIWDASPDWTDRLVDKNIVVLCSNNAPYTIVGSSPYLLPHGGIGRKLVSSAPDNSDFLIYNIYLGTGSARTGIIGSYSGETIQGLNDKGVVVTHKLKVIDSIGIGDYKYHPIVGRIYGVSVSLKSAKEGFYQDTFTLNIIY